MYPAFSCCGTGMAAGLDGLRSDQLSQIIGLIGPDSTSGLADRPLSANTRHSRQVADAHTWPVPRVRYLGEVVTGYDCATYKKTRFK